MTDIRVLGQLSTTLRAWQRGALTAAAIGVAASAAAALLDLTQFLQSYLIGFIFWWLVAMGCLGLLTLYYLGGGNWGAAVKPLLESGAITVPLVGLLFLPIALNIDRLYPWTEPDVISAEKARYLNPSFFYVRAVLYFVVWTAFALVLCSGKATASTARPPWRRLVSAGGLVIVVLTVSFAAIDWGMSLDPAWYSSIYGGQMVVGGALAAMALATLTLAAVERRQGDRRQGDRDIILPRQTLADLGTLLLTFVMLWAYFAFSQYLIIWSGNLPEENFWYVDRTRGGWQWIGVIAVVLQFGVPFASLLSRDFKHDPIKLAGIAALAFVMQFVFLFWTLSPSFHPRRLHVHWADIAVPVAIGGVWTSVFLWLLRRRAEHLLIGNQR